MMTHAPVHPSQRRVACDLCRRHKSKCQRIQRNDPKCSRCMVLDAECVAGQQRKVGRPKHSAISAREAHQGPGSMSRPTANTAFRKKAPGRQSRQSHLLAHGQSPDSECPAYNPAPKRSAVTAAESCSVPTMTRPASGTETIHQRSFNLNIPYDYHESPLANIDSSIDLTTSDDHANRIYRDPSTLAMAGQERLRGDIANTEAIVNLSKVNLDLHIRLAAAEMNRTILDLNSLIYREGPLFIQNYTLAEFVLKTSEDFSQILTRLCASQTPCPSHNLTPTSSLAFSYVPTKQLPAPLALTITSIFTQLISLYEVFLDHLIARIERLSTEPVEPIPNVKFKGLLRPDQPCVQGMIFSNLVVELLEEIEGSLGINKMPLQREIGLLSARQVDVLWSELEGRVGITSRDGAMKPADVKQLFRKAAIILHQFSLRE
ncbi:hypothetical protein BDW68DRAFT_198490 [Aspergillus falconensis]